MDRESYFLPLIARQDYETFRRLNGSDLPDTYDEWFKLHSKEKLERGQVGYMVEERHVDPREFVRYCGARGIAPTGLNLLRFVEGNAAGENY